MRWLDPIIAALAGIADPYDNPLRELGPISAETASRPGRRASGGVQRLRGIPVSPGFAVGPARIVLSSADAKRVQAGEIVIARWIGPTHAALLGSAAGVVSERGGPHAGGAVLARERGLPMAVGIGDATLLIRSGDRVAVDGATGQVVVEGRG